MPQRIRLTTQREAFETLADQVRDVKGLADTIIFAHHGRRLYNSSTPAGIGIFAGAELLGHSQEDWDDIRSHKRDPAPAVKPPGPSVRKSRRR